MHICAPQPIIPSQLRKRCPEIIAGVSTRKGGVSPEPFGLNMSYMVGDSEENVSENRRIFFSKIGIPADRLAIPRQVHGANVIAVSGPGSYENCDSLITDIKGLYLVVTVADCLPIFLYDRMNKIISVVHAGWKGSSLRIVEKTFMVFINSYKSNPKDMAAYLGPSARACCYQVGEDVSSQFDKEYANISCNGRIYLDLIKFNKDILNELGLCDENIEISEYCTICNPADFHSYRRDRGKSGRMMAVIGIKDISSGGCDI